MSFKPMLASALKTEKDWSKVKYPLIATPKLDGIRVLKLDGTLYTRSLKPIRNKHIQSLAHEVPDGLDGEIMTYEDEACTRLNDFNTIQSHVMRGDGKHYWRFCAFDDFTIPTLPYIERLRITQQKCQGKPYCSYVPHETVENKKQLDEVILRHQSENWEGTMVRLPLGHYKRGRSSVNEGLLLKIKQFDDDEAIVIGWKQLKSNQNEITQNELGENERSGHKDGMVLKDELGAITCTWKSIEFDIGSGFDAEQRKLFWETRDELIGMKATFRYQGQGSHGRPRFPTFVGFRSDI